jgi:hypothetical protein
VLRRAANEVAQQNLPGAGLRLFDLEHDLPDAWHRFQGQATAGQSIRELSLRLGRNMFAFLPGRRDLSIHRLALLFEAPGAEPSTHRRVEFLIGKDGGQQKKHKRDHEMVYINCIASAEWPGLYHGVLDIELGPLAQSGHADLGTLRFPADIGQVSRAFLVCGYDVT